MNIQQALELGVKKLQSESAKIDCEYLLTDLLNKNSTWLKTWPEYELSKEQQTHYLETLKRRQQGEPIAYITGEQGFWNLSLNTNSSTLIPRSETELLVETGLEHLTNVNNGRILDLGTGTGAIALAIASMRLNDKVYGCDFQQQAVELAKTNAIKNNLDNVSFFVSNWFSSITINNFNLIVANPPYVGINDSHLKKGDLVFEPLSALVADDEGFADINLIVTQASNFLVAEGCLIIEHGFEQGKQVNNLFKQQGYSQVKTIQDLAGLDRLTMGIKPND